MSKYKHYLVIILPLIVAFLVSGCNSIPSSSGSYRYKEAVKDGHVVSGPAGLANIEKLEQFYETFQIQEEAKLRIVHYTDEGDPVYLDLNSNGQTIQFSRNNSDDKFGGQDKGKKSTTCAHIIKKIGSRAERYGTEYDLQDCTDDIGYSDSEKKEYFLLFIEGKK